MTDADLKSNGSNQSDCPFAAGDTVHNSGLYEICHYDEPRTTVVLVANSVFPYCRKCSEKVRYKLLEAVPHISEDPDFNEFFNAPDNPSTEDAAPKWGMPVQLGLAYGFRFCQDPVQTWRASPEAGDL